MSLRRQEDCSSRTDYAGQRWQENSISKNRGLSGACILQLFKRVPRVGTDEFFQQSNGSLFKLTQEEYEFLLDVIRESNPLPEAQEKREAYDETRLLSEFTWMRWSFRGLIPCCATRKM